ncbi:MAG TPA: undecaprenyl-diphosphate phosphatase [Nitrospirota bacterium]|nr:undecaprenyl-diphosphate phosphatase [Nitrospirota bacterium]HUL00937.1 undecaprenyl-diphosphate phosphatase [Nitrospirota bacterium]
MIWLKILILAIVQGAAELLPVSSSAHVIVAEKLMGLDPTSPEMTLLLVMLHTGTMFAVIFFFWKSWKATFFSSRMVLWDTIKLITAATFLTGIIGLLLKYFIEKFILGDVPHAEIEHLFGNMVLISAALAAVGLLIMFAGWKSHRTGEKVTLGLKQSCWIGAVQGICLPFRGFSRSGATISTGLLLGIAKQRVEEFSFALAVVLTPPVIVREVLRLLNARHASSVNISSVVGLFYPSLLGMVLSFASGILALKWLSLWLERGRWHLFGIYCLCAAVVVFLIYRSGF